MCCGNILTVDISIGQHAITNLDCTVGHDAILEDYITLYLGVNMSGCLLLERKVEIGTGSQIIRGKMESRIIGAGAVVTKDLPTNCTAVGAPAKSVKFRE